MVHCILLLFPSLTLTSDLRAGGVRPKDRTEPVKAPPAFKSARSWMKLLHFLAQANHHIPRTLESAQCSLMIQAEAALKLNVHISVSHSACSVFQLVPFGCLGVSVPRLCQKQEDSEATPSPPWNLEPKTCEEILMQEAEVSTGLTCQGLPGSARPEPQVRVWHWIRPRLPTRLAGGKHV